VLLFFLAAVGGQTNHAVFFAFRSDCFFVTAMLFTIAGKKQFMGSTSKVINYQLSQLEASKEPDFIWNGINHSEPELYNLLEILTNLSSTFYTVRDISVYSKVAEDTTWYRLYFTDGPTLQSDRILDDPYTGKLERWLNRHFRPARAKIMSADGLHTMFVNITGPKDKNNYFLKIGVDSEGMAGFMKKQVKILILFLLISLLKQVIEFDHENPKHQLTNLKQIQITKAPNSKRLTASSCQRLQPHIIILLQTISSGGHAGPDPAH
jgi:hypothetical protein